MCIRDSNHLRVATLLLRKKASLTFNDQGNWPLHFAASHRNVHVARILVGNQDVCVANKFGHTALHIAATQGDMEMVDVLLKHTDIDCADSNGYTALHMAAFNNEALVVHQLLQNCADPNKQAHGNVVPMHLAARNGYFNIVKMLWLAGADVDIMSTDGQTPLCCAIGNNQNRVARWLVRYANASTTLAGSQGTAFDVARTSNNARLFEWLGRTRTPQVPALQTCTLLFGILPTNTLECK